MASAPAPPVASTKKTTNYARLCRLLVGVGSQALRDTFDRIHPPPGLHLVLARNPAHRTLQSLRTRKILNPTQWGKLYPTIPSSVLSASFDITLLMVLLRNICHLTPPVTGWDNLPPAADTSTEANIARVKYYRNTVYGHASQASVDDAMFNTHWQEISNALVALGGANYEAAIKKLKNECMDPETEEHYRELLKEWKEDEDSIREKLEEMEAAKLPELASKLERLTVPTGSTPSTGENIRASFQPITRQVSVVIVEVHVAEMTGDRYLANERCFTPYELQQMKSEIGIISDKLDTLMAQSETEVKERDDFKEMKREIQTISEKLNEENTWDKVEELKDAVDALRNRLPPVERKPRIEAKLIGEIRQQYKDREGWLAPFPWCEGFHFHLDDILTRLKVVSRKKTREIVTANIVNMSGIFKPHEECPQPRTVLIEGKPGMGKTTYCRKLAYDWATGKPWTTGKQEEKDCFPRFETVLLLKCCDMKSDLWETIADQLLPGDVEEHVRKGFFNSIRENQTKVLLILDGLDEVAASKLPMISKIIEGKELRKCRLVATARHEAGIKVRIHCDTLLEIEGFAEEDARKLIFKYFQESEDMAKKLLSELTRDENLKDMAANPLNTALLCLDFEEYEGSFPESRSQLYLDITQCILRRYRKKKGLPETKEDLIEVYDAQLKHLGWIALNGLLEDKLDFEESELNSNADKSPAFEFLSVQTGGSKIRPSRRYSFPHKSFQEWFAAFFLSCQLIEKKISPESLVAEKKYAHELNEVLPYTSGLLAVRCQKEAVTLIKCIMTKVNHGVKEDSDGWLTVVLECTRECKQKHSSFQANLARELGSFLKLQTLELHDGKISAANVVVLADVLKSNTTLTELDLSVNDIGGAGAANLAGELKSNTTLTVLKLSRNDIGDAGAAHLAAALKSNTTLTELYLSRNGIGKAGAADMADGLKSNRTLTELDLSDNVIGDAGAAALAHGLKSNTTLIVLYLSANDIGNGVAGLADGLKSNTALSTLNLSHNAIGNADAAGLADLLKSSTKLSALNLSHNGIGDAGVAGLADALKSNATPRVLNLSENLIDVTGIAGLVDGLKSNTTLRELNLSLNRIGDAGAAYLADGLKSNATLTVLNLSYNLIGDAGTANLAEALKSNTNLTVLHLSGSGIGNDGAACLASALKSNKTLTVLYLWDNGICDAGAASLADALKSDTTLTRLCLSGNKIGNDGLARLAGMLESNRKLTVDLFSPFVNF